MKFMDHFKMLVAILAFDVIKVTVAQNPPTDADCTGPDPFPDPAICSSYYQCFLIDTGYVLMHFDCPPGGIWMDTACVEGTCPEPTTTLEPTTLAPTTEAATTEIATTTTTLAPTTVGPSDTTPGPTTTPTTSPPVTNPPTFQCPSEGLFPHSTDPTKYYQCVLIGSQFYYYVYACPTNSCFQPSSGRCVVGSCPGSVTPVPSSPPTTTTTRATTTTTRATTTAIPTTTTSPTTVASTTTTATVPPNPCPTEGLFPNSNDCQAYYQCVRISGRMYIYNYRCPAGAYWSVVYSRCVVGTCPT